MPGRNLEHDTREDGVKYKVEEKVIEEKILKPSVAEIKAKREALKRQQGKEKKWLDIDNPAIWSGSICSDF